MTSQHPRPNTNETQRWDGLPEPVCQQPDKNTPEGCAMQQLAGHQRKPVGAFKRTLNAPVWADALRRPEEQLDQPHMIRA